MRRVLSLWLPYWPSERPDLARPRPAPFAPPEPARPVALTFAQAGGQRLYAVNPAAVAAGLRPGLTLADARALLPELATRPAAPAADARALAALADWCQRYSPWRATDGSDGLLLGTTGAAHLFGGEAGLLADLAARLARLGLTARLALADGALAAQALARHGAGSSTLVAPGGNPDALAPLPVAALGLEPAAARELARLGLRRIADLVALPAASLASRFGRAVPGRLAAALAGGGPPLSPRQPVPVLVRRLAFAEPIARPEDVAAATRLLLDPLCQDLAAQGLGARRLELCLYLSDGQALRFAVGLAAASRDAGHAMRLLAGRLAGLDAGFGADLLTLAVTASEPLDAAQLALAGQATRHADGPALAELIDRLAARLGEDKLGRFAARQSHLPERAVAVVPPLDTGAPADWPATAPRPVCLLPQPEQIEAVAEIPDGPPALFRWRGRLQRVARADGPERLAPEWWRAGGRPEADALAAGTRDYYRVEATGGERYWLFRQGLYGTGAAPGWFLHGLFA